LAMADLRKLSRVAARASRVQAAEADAAYREIARTLKRDIAKECMWGGVQ
jgi:hypothetical protein